jgi:hypothetical protein
LGRKRRKKIDSFRWSGKRYFQVAADNQTLEMDWAKPYRFLKGGI